ncbi:MAG: G5 domain-containing protein [Armatimonadota bacterium]
MWEPTADNEVQSLRRRLWIERGVFATVIVAGALAVWRPSLPALPGLQPQKWAVYVGDKPVAALATREAAQAALEQAKRSEDPTGAASFAEPVKVAPLGKADLPVLAGDAAADKLAEAVKLTAERGVVYIDGMAVVALPTEREAHEVLEAIKQGFAGKLQGVDAAPTFKEQVEVRTEPATDDLWADKETALGLLRGEGAEEEGSYKVVSGDSGWIVARKHDMSLDQLQKRNPGVRLDRLSVGQTLRVGETAEPILTVVTEGRVQRTVSSSFSIRIQRSPKMYVGKRMLVQPGRPGRDRVTYKVRCENGRVVHEEPLKRETLAPPSHQVVVLGAKPRR